MKHNDTHQIINIDNGTACIDCQIESESGSLTTKINRESMEALGKLSKGKLFDLELDIILDIIIKDRLLIESTHKGNYKDLKNAINENREAFNEVYNQL